MRGNLPLPASLHPPIRPVWWEDGAVCLIDQTRLPLQERTVRLASARGVWRAVRTLQVRGAPAIGVAAAFGMAAEAFRLLRVRPERIVEGLREAAALLRTARPTAYNLFCAVDRICSAIDRQGEMSGDALASFVLEEAARFYREDLACGRAIGRHGMRLIRSGARVLTHCNAGGLATSGFGTALAPVYAAVRAGKKVHVFVDETRPVLQGARLTAWELGKAGVAHTLICDNMAGWLMKQGRIDLVIVGADRIAANGDTANKIGTYSLAVLARHHGVPLYVAAPFSTFDPGVADGSGIPIEERSEEEVKKVRGRQIAPSSSSAWNPAFDITPACLIAGYITEKGVLTPPFG